MAELHGYRLEACIAEGARESKGSGQFVLNKRRWGLVCAPHDAYGAWHALGLTLARREQRAEALGALAEAHRLAPDESDYSYAYAIALRDAGRSEEAAQLLRSLPAHR